MALHGGSGDHVAKAIATDQGEKHGLPGHPHLEFFKAGADEGEAPRQSLLHLTKPPEVGRGNGYLDLTPRGGPVSREGSAGAMGLCLDCAGLRQQRCDARRDGDGQRGNGCQIRPFQDVLLSTKRAAAARYVMKYRVSNPTTGSFSMMPSK